MQTPPRVHRVPLQPNAPIRRMGRSPARMNPGGSPGTPRRRSRNSPRETPHRQGTRRSGVPAGSPNRGGSRRRRKSRN